MTQNVIDKLVIVAFDSSVEFLSIERVSVNNALTIRNKALGMSRTVADGHKLIFEAGRFSPQQHSLQV